MFHFGILVVIVGHGIGLRIPQRDSGRRFERGRISRAGRRGWGRSPASPLGLWRCPAGLPAAHPRPVFRGYHRQRQGDVPCWWRRRRGLGATALVWRCRRRYNYRETQMVPPGVGTATRDLMAAVLPDPCADRVGVKLRCGRSPGWYTRSAPRISVPPVHHLTAAARSWC